MLLVAKHLEGESKVVLRSHIAGLDRKRMLVGREGCGKLLQAVFGAAAIVPGERTVGGPLGDPGKPSIGIAVVAKKHVVRTNGHQVRGLRPA